MQHALLYLRSLVKNQHQFTLVSHANARLISAANYANNQLIYARRIHAKTTEDALFLKRIAMIISVYAFLHLLVRVANTCMMNALVNHAIMAVLVWLVLKVSDANVLTILVAKHAKHHSNLVIQ